MSGSTTTITACLSLYVVNGRPLDDSMHPYPLKEKPAHHRTIIYTAMMAMATLQM